MQDYVEINEYHISVNCNVMKRFLKIFSPIYFIFLKFARKNRIYLRLIEVRKEL